MTRAAITAAVVGVGVVAAVPARSQERMPCEYGSHRPAPIRVAKLPAQVVAGRRIAYEVIARGYRGRLFGKLTRLTIRFERVDNGQETFTADRLSAFKRAKPGENIGYDVRLRASSPGERAIVSWTDAAAEPCTGEARTGDVHVTTARRPRRPVVSGRSGETDERHGDSALLRVGGSGRDCALTDPARLTVVAKSAGVTKRLQLDMACGDFKTHAPLRVDRFTLLPEDGAYKGAARLYVSPRAAPTPGAELSLAVYKGTKRVGSKTFRATQTATGTKVVTR